MKIRLLIFIILLCSLRGYSQSCTLSAAISSSEPGICAGSTIDLTATASGGKGQYNYAWSTGETINPIHVNKAGNYTVVITDKTTGCTASNTITVNITPTPNAPKITGGGQVCQGTVAHLAVTSSADSYQWYMQATGGKPFHTGATYNTDPVTGFTAYFVEATVGGCTSLRTGIAVDVVSRPVARNAQACSGSPVTLSVSNGENYKWYTSNTSTNVINSGPTLVIPSLKKTVSYFVESNVNGCTSQRTVVTATLTSAPDVPVIKGNNTVCSGSVISLHADAAAGNIDWFDTPNGGTPLISSPDYTTQPLTANTTFYVQNTVNGCVSKRVAVTIKVNPIPTAPAKQTVNSCYNTSVHLTAGTSGTYLWYADADGKHILKQGLTYDTPALTSSVTYYLMEVNSGCGSVLSPINIIVAPPVSAPSVINPPVICNGSSAVLSAVAPGGIYQWFKTATDNTPLPTIKNGEFTTPPLTATTTYYVQTTLGGCTSSRTAVKVTLLSPVESPVVKDATACIGDNVTLSATGPAGEYAWYDSSNTLVQVGRVFTVSAIAATTTYNVQVSMNGCISSKVPVKVTVTPSPQAPVAGPSPVICPGDKANLSANTVAGSSIDWYVVATGGTSINTGDTYTTPPLYADKTYYVQSNSGSCSSERTPIQVTINNAGTAFTYPSATVTTTGSDPTPVIVNPSGGTFSGPPGLVFISTITGQIDVSASIPGTYNIVLTSSGACSGKYVSSITITDKPNTAFTYDTPICRDGNNPKPKLAVGATAGVFTSVPSGLVFTDKYKGEIDLAKTTKGTYTITNTIPPSGLFLGDSSSFKITIDEPVSISAGSDKSVPLNTAVTLNGSIAGVSGGTWSGGAGTFSDIHNLHAIYTPATDEGQAVLTLVSADPPGACGQKSATVTITFNTTPPAPTASGTDICTGTKAILNATAPGGTYNWYSTASGGSSIKQGASFTTPTLTTPTTYYVETTLNGLTSLRTAVAVNVYDVPPTPKISSDTVIVCAGSTANLVASGSVGTYQWFNESGQSVGTGDTFVTSTLNTNTFYNVQSAVGQCVSAMKKVVVVVNSAPYITSKSSDFVCSGNALNYTITANLPSATFSWDRVAVAGISNPAQTNQTSVIITETLINTTANPINVTYVITPLSGTCFGAPINYVVTVYPTPIITSDNKTTICNGTTANYQIVFNTAAQFSWSRATVPGISNNAVNGQAASIIKEVLYNNTNAPVDVVYVINYKTNDCDGTSFNWLVTVNPAINITSDTTSIACNKTPQGYTITSNIPDATFSWARGAVASISNPATTGTGALIDEALQNTAGSSVKINYIITPTANGCSGTPFVHIVTVNPKPGISQANSNSPVCVGSTINLRTPSLNGATYMWTGPNGFSSTLQNPDIPSTAASTGTYNLFVTIAGCTSDAGVVAVQVNEPPVVEAHGPSLVCTDETVIALTGSVKGGTTTGVWTSSNPNNTKFLPSPTSIDKVQYIPSAEEKAKGSVTLTLSSTSKDDCKIATASVVIKFGKTAGVAAGSDQTICSQENRIQLAGKILEPSGAGHWTTSGKGKFSSATQADAFYLPDPADIQAGSVTLTLHADNAGVCYTESDKLVVTFVGPPVLVTERVRYVLTGKSITLNPTMRDFSVRYLWSPNINITDVNIKNPVVTGGDVNQTYVLTIVDSLGCVSIDSTVVIVSPQLSVSNVFSPNGDGINDNWEIVGLTAYENATVDIFNRYGSLVFHSKGYGIPWDGLSNGSPMPSGVYYYIVDTKVNGQIFKGNVTILR